MTDYTKPTGSSGTMMIRDVGNGWVEFWINSNNNTTFNSALPWGWTVDGITGTSTYNYPKGAGWRRVSSYYVVNTQTVTFRLGATGTTGFGGPTTFNQFISRQTVPGPPQALVIYPEYITANSMYMTFNGGSDGGSPILEWQIGYGTDPWNAQLYWGTSGASTITGLASGTTYYFWVRARNALGWGAWSNRSSATTLNNPGQMTAPLMTNVTQISAVATFTPPADAGSPITAYQIGYTTSATLNPSTIVTVTSPATITGLPPATTLYFRVRAQNAIGWSSWSAATMIRTVAGAKVKVGAVYKDAVPYVKVGGVWKLATPYVRTLGVWRPTL